MKIEILKRAIQLRNYMKQYHIGLEWKTTSEYYKHEEGESGTSYSLNFFFSSDKQYGWEGDKAVLSMLQKSTQSPYFSCLLEEKEDRPEEQFFKKVISSDVIEFFETFDHSVSRNFDYSEIILKEFPELVIEKALGNKYEEFMKKNSSYFKYVITILEQDEEKRNSPSTKSFREYYSKKGSDYFVKTWREKVFETSFSEKSLFELREIEEDICEYKKQTRILSILRYFLPELISEEKIKEKEVYIEKVSQEEYVYSSILREQEKKMQRETERKQRDDFMSLLTSYRDQGMIRIPLIRDKKNEGNFVGKWNGKIVIFSPYPEEMMKKEVDYLYGKFINKDAIVRIITNKEKVAFAEVLMLVNVHEGLIW